MSMSTTISGQERMLRVADLRIDTQYQRNLKEGWARMMADNWDQFLYDPMDVSLRPDGTSYVMDGQHRLAALRILGYDNTVVACRVFTGLTLAQEARRFNTQGNRKPLNAQEQFRARLFEGQAAEMAVDECVRRSGYALNFTGTEVAGGRILCVSALLSVYKAGGSDHLLDTLNTISSGFGLADGPSARTVQGISAFLRKYSGEGLDRGRLHKVLRETNSDEVERNTLALQSLRKMSPRDAYRQTVADLYNHRRAGDRRLVD